MNHVQKLERGGAGCGIVNTRRGAVVEVGHTYDS